MCIRDSPLNIQLILSKEQQSMFISTVGNINIFSGFASMYVSMAFAVFCTGKKKSTKIGGMFGIIIGMSGLIAGNSDSGFLGLVAEMCIRDRHTGWHDQWGICI